MTTYTSRTWETLVRAADKDFDDKRLRPVAYKMSNGREFKDRPDPYAVSTSTS